MHDDKECVVLVDDDVGVDVVDVVTVVVVVK